VPPLFALLEGPLLKRAIGEDAERQPEGKGRAGNLQVEIAQAVQGDSGQPAHGTGAQAVEA